MLGGSAPDGRLLPAVGDPRHLVKLGEPFVEPGGSGTECVADQQMRILVKDCRQCDIDVLAVDGDVVHILSRLQITGDVGGVAAKQWLDGIERSVVRKDDHDRRHW